MHQRLIVASLHDTRDSIGSEFVNVNVYDWLNSNGFASEGGRWNNSPADWYVIGGRWSGELTKVVNGIKWVDYADFAKSICTEEENKECNWDKFAHSHLIKKYRAEFNEWWVNKTGENTLHPFNRDSYTSYDDDSQILTEELWKHFNSEGVDRFGSQCEESWIMIDDYTEGIEYSEDTQWFELENKWHKKENSDDFLEDLDQGANRIWLTTVDYHN